MIVCMSARAERNRLSGTLPCSSTAGGPDDAMERAGQLVGTDKIGFLVGVLEEKQNTRVYTTAAISTLYLPVLAMWLAHSWA